MMFCGGPHLQRIPKNNTLDAIDGTYVDNSNIHPFFVLWILVRIKGEDICNTLYTVPGH